MIVCVLIPCALAGCAHLPTHQATATHPAATPLAHGRQAIRKASLHRLLAFNRRLAATDAAGREAAVQVARAQQRRTPDAVADANLALALAAPHQSSYAPDQAARYARLALAAQTPPWSPDAAEYLSELARWLDLASSQSQDDRTTIESLQIQLATARAKLEALSNIEPQISTGTRP